MDSNLSVYALVDPYLLLYDTHVANCNVAVGLVELKSMKTRMNVSGAQVSRSLTASAIALSAVVLLAGILLLPLPAFAAPAVAPEQMDSHAVQSAKVLFKESKVYEIVFFTLTEGMEKQILEEYLSQAAPFFDKYGVKTIGMFSVVESRSDDLQSKMVGIFEWPDYAAKEELESDEAFQRIATLRDGAFSFFKSGWFSTKEDRQVTFYSDKIYELAGATLHPTEEAKALIGKYFEVSEPIKRSYGGAYPEFLVEMTPTDANGTSTYSNAMQFIVQWDSVEDNKKLFANEEFRTQAAPLMQKAIAKADFVFAKFLFNEG